MATEFQSLCDRLAVRRHQATGQASQLGSGEPLLANLEPAETGGKRSRDRRHQSIVTRMKLQVGDRVQVRVGARHSPPRYSIKPSIGDDAVAYNLRGIRPDKNANRPASTARFIARAIDTDSDTILDAPTSRAIAATVEAALQSARTGRAVDVC